MSAVLPLGIDAVAPKPVKQFDAIDYAVVVVGSFAFAFMFGTMIGCISDCDFAAKYNFEAEALDSIVGDLKGTVCTMLFATLPIMAVASGLMMSQFYKKGIKNTWLAEEKNNQWDKPWSMVAMGVAAAGLALIVSALVMQNCDGMRRINEYYNQCEHTGIGMHAVDMTQVYASMSTMALWNGLLQATLITGAALMASAVGSAVYMSSKEKKKEALI